MARIQLKTDADSFEDMVARAAARAGLTDISRSSSWGQLIWAIASEFGEAYYQLANLRNLFDISTAAGSDLDEVATTIVPGSLTRLPSVRAVGEVVFTRSVDTGTTEVVPAGTAILTEDGTRFITTEAAVVVTGGAEIIAGNGTGRDAGPVAAVAQSPGSAGNVGAGTVTQFAGRPTGFTAVTNVTAFVGGSDIESDDFFRARLQAYVAGLSRCTPQAIEAVLQGVQDPTTSKIVRFVKVIEDPIDRGNFTVYVDDGAGTASETILLTPTSGVASIGKVGGGTGAGTYTLVSTEPLFREDMVGSAISLSGSSFPNNNVTPAFSTSHGKILSFVDSRTITYNTTLAADSTQPAPTSWSVSALYPINPWGGSAGAIGGEEFIEIGVSPVAESTVTVTSSSRGLLSQGVEYYLNPGSGQLYFSPPLSTGEYLEIAGSMYTGLVELVQRIVDGDATDRGNFPGLRAAGTRAIVLSPTITVLTVEAKVQVLRGYSASDVLDQVRTAITNYINNLGISADVVRHEIIERIMAVQGTYDVDLLSPTENVIVLDSEIPRVTSSTLIVS